MSAKKNKKKSLAKKITKKLDKKPVKKLPAKKSVKKAVKKEAKKAVKKVVKKPAPKPKKVATKKAPVKKVEVKKTAKIKAAKPLPKKKEVVKKAEKKVEKKVEKNTAKHSLAKTILAKSTSKEKVTQPEKVEPEKPAEKKFDSLKKAILVRKADDGVKLNFKIGDYAIYPSHGVGKIVGIEKTEIAGQDFSCYLMNFEREKLTIKIPASSAKKIGLRHPISKAEMDEVFVILRSGVKKLKGMWSRRAQEYETKINSGDIILLAEVIRDLTRDIEDADRSYSERIIYETAIYRLASEYAAIYKVDFEEAKDKIVLTAKDKLSGEQRSSQKDDFDDFDDFDNEKSDSDDEDEEGDDEEEEEEDDDFDFDDDEDDDDSPRKKRKKK